MKLENYKRDDIADALEIKKMILHQLEQIEMNLWTDDIDTAIQRTVDMNVSLINLSRMQSSKRLEDAFEKAGVHGIRIDIVKFKHKKVD